MSSSSKKRRREQEVTPSVDNLQKMMDLSFDRTMIDTLIESHMKDTDRSSETAPDVLASKDSMYCCPRAYENNFLREPVGSERLCARGKNCEALQIDIDSPFILREFIYPGTEPQDMRSICLLCRRYEISLAFYAYETGNSQSTPGLRVSEHYNLVGIPGEYDVRDCIVSEATGSGLPLPVVLHSRTAYNKETIDGIKHLAQARMRYPGGTEIERGPFLTRRAGLDPKLARSNCLK